MTDLQCAKCKIGYGMFPLRGKMLCRACWRTAIGGTYERECSTCKREKQACLRHRGDTVKLTEKTILAELETSMRRYEEK